MNQWKSSIPIELHADFQRQVDERVNSELMAVLREGTVDENAMEAELIEKFTEFYHVAFLSKEWPPKAAGVALGVRAGELMKVHSDHWICAHCRERNFNSFETCRKCSENKPDHTERPLSLREVKQVPVVEVAAKPVVWFCKECTGRNSLNNTHCSGCGLHQDVLQRDSWPRIAEVGDPEIRKALRRKLFRLTLEHFGVDDPFSSIEISDTEFTQAVDILKKRVLAEYNKAPFE